ncbi:MAG: Rieske (2Fe-2S) protein [Nitrososphaeraceae archaeon]
MCDANLLKDGDIVSFSHDDGKRKLIIARIKGKLYAKDGICTHAYAELSNGFLNEEDKTVTCPLHLSAFDLQSGSS